MAHVIFRHTVESYAKWRPLFNEQASLREAAGAIGEPMVFRSGDNPFEVLVLMEWEELEMARKWAVSDELKAAMEESGVNDEPTVTFLTQV